MSAADTIQRTWIPAMPTWTRQAGAEAIARLVALASKHRVKLPTTTASIVGKLVGNAGPLASQAFRDQPLPLTLHPTLATWMTRVAQGLDATPGAMPADLDQIDPAVWSPIDPDSAWAAVVGLPHGHSRTVTLPIGGAISELPNNAGVMLDPLVTGGSVVSPEAGTVESNGATMIVHAGRVIHLLDGVNPTIAQGAKVKSGQKIGTAAGKVYWHITTDEGMTGLDPIAYLHGRIEPEATTVTLDPEETRPPKPAGGAKPPKKPTAVPPIPATPTTPRTPAAGPELRDRIAAGAANPFAWLFLLGLLLAAGRRKRVRRGRA